MEKRVTRVGLLPTIKVMAMKKAPSWYLEPLSFPLLCGRWGIQTPDTRKRVYRISSPAHSVTLPTFQKTTGGNSFCSLRQNRRQPFVRSCQQPLWEICQQPFWEFCQPLRGISQPGWEISPLFWSRSNTFWRRSQTLLKEKSPLWLIMLAGQ